MYNRKFISFTSINGRLILYPHKEKVTSKMINYLKQFEFCSNLLTKEILGKLQQEESSILQLNFDYYDYFEVESKAKDLNIDIRFEFDD